MNIGTGVISEQFDYKHENLPILHEKEKHVQVITQDRTRNIYENTNNFTIDFTSHFIWV